VVAARRAAFGDPVAARRNPAGTAVLFTAAAEPELAERRDAPWRIGAEGTNVDTEASAPAGITCASEAVVVITSAAAAIA